MIARLLLPLAAVALVAAIGCESSRGDPDDFVQFADEIARAAEDGDTGFFAERVEGEFYTCTAADVEGSTGPNAPPDAICVEEGMQFEAIPISNYGTIGRVQTPEVLIRDIEGFFEAALSEVEDQYGSGDVRLYATGRPTRPGTEEDTGLRTAILTALHDFEGRSVRSVRGIDFEFVGDRWVIRSELTAVFPVAVDLLTETSAAAVYADWTPY